MEFKKFNFKEDIKNMKKGVVYTFKNNDSYKFSNKEIESENDIDFIGFLL